MALNATDIWVNQLRAMQQPGVRRGSAEWPYILPDTPVVQPPGVHTMPESLFSWPAWLQPTPAIKRVDPNAGPVNSGQPSGGAMANTRGALGPVGLMDMYKLPRELQRQLIEQRAKELQAQQEYEHAQTMQAQTAMQGAQGTYEQAAQAPTDRMSPGSEFVGRLFGNVSQALDPRMGGQQVAEGTIGQQNQNLKENQHKRLLIMEAQAQRLAERYDRLGQVEEAHKWAGQAEKAAMQRERLMNEANWNADNEKLRMQREEMAATRAARAKEAQFSQRQAEVTFQQQNIDARIRVIGEQLKLLKKKDGGYTDQRAAKRYIQELDQLQQSLGKLTLEDPAVAKLRAARDRGVPLQQALQFAETEEDRQLIQRVYSEARN